MFGKVTDPYRRSPEDVARDQEARDRWQEHYDGLCKQYPHVDDPRRDTDFWTRTDSSIANRLLSAILTELQRINDRTEAHVPETVTVGRTP